MDLEPVGGAVTGGLIAAAVERPTGEAGEAHHHCSDCGAETQGRFCSNCGQPTHVHRTLLHLGEELLHGVMHFDARIWRTLPLLAFNPGRLTREWIQGRRTRYVSPLALFLFTIFLLFFILSFSGGGLPSGTTAQAQLAVRQAAVVNEREDQARAMAALTQAQTAAAAQPADAEASAALDEAQADFARANDSLAEAVESERQMQVAMVTPRGDGLEPGSWQAGIKDLSAQGKAEKGSGGEHLLKKLQNPDLAFYKLQQTLYKFAFLLVPMSIPFMALLFVWRRGTTLYDHGVFVLYSLTFVSIIGMAAAGLIALNSGLARPVVTLISLAIPVHMFFQLKGAYSLRIFSALWRTAFLLIFCTIAASLFLAAIVYLGLGA